MILLQITDSDIVLAIISNFIQALFTVAIAVITFIANNYRLKFKAEKELKAELKDIYDKLKAKENADPDKSLTGINYIVNPIEIFVWESYKGELFSGLSRQRKAEYARIYKPIEDLKYLLDRKNDFIQAGNRAAVVEINHAIGNLISSIKNSLSDFLNLGAN